MNGIESITNSRAKSIMRNGIARVAINLGIMLTTLSLGFLTLYEMLDKHGQSVYGMLAYYVGLTELVSKFIASQSWQTAIIELTKIDYDRNERRLEIISKLLCMDILFALLAIVVLLMIMMAGNGDREIGWVSIALLVIYPVTSLRSVFEGVIRERNAHWIISLSALASASLVYGIVRISNDSSSYIVAYVLAGYASLAFVIFTCVKWNVNLKVWISAISRLVRPLNEYSRSNLSISATGSLNVLRQKGEAVVIGAFISYEMLAIYEIFKKIAQAGMQFIDMGRQLFYKEIIVYASDERSLRRVLKVSIILTTLALLILYYTRHIWVGLISNKFSLVITERDLNSALTIFAPIILYSFYLWVGPYMNSVGRQGIVLFVSTEATLVMLTSFLYLVLSDDPSIYGYGGLVFCIYFYMAMHLRKKGLMCPQ